MAGYRLLADVVDSVEMHSDSNGERTDAYSITTMTFRKGVCYHVAYLGMTRVDFRTNNNY